MTQVVIRLLTPHQHPLLLRNGNLLKHRLLVVIL